MANRSTEIVSGYTDGARPITCDLSITQTPTSKQSLLVEFHGSLTRAIEQATAEPRAYTTAEIANRFRLLRTGDARTPDEEPIVEADLANTKRTLAKLESEGHRFHHGAPSEDY